MYNKVFKTMILLVITFILGLYVMKFFFPEKFVMIIENETLVSIGHFIDERWWLQEICDIFFSFITYWLYLGAVLRKWTLNWKEILAVLITIGISHGLYFIDAGISTYIPLIAMIILPAIFGSNLKIVAMVYSVHCLAQLLSTSIRSLPTLLTDVNYVTIVLMTIECYFWLLLFYVALNYDKQKE